MISDPIGDMLTRIKNGYLAKNAVVEVPYSKIKEEIAKILVKEKFLKNYQVRENKFKKLVLELKYQNGKPAVEGVKRVSKPGVRIYASADKIPLPKFGLGITLVSTSKGIMSHKEARKKKLGGEVIGQIW